MRTPSMIHRRNGAGTVAVLVAILGSGCAERVAGEPSKDQEGNDVHDDVEPEDPGERPTEAGEMYVRCEQQSDCTPLEFCVFPAGGSGFCTAACGSPDDASVCDPAPGGQPLTCLDIGLPDQRRVCALDCSDADCPDGMRCEGVATDNGEQSICF